MILYARIPRQYLVDANYNELTPDKWELFETGELLVVNAKHRATGRWFTVRAEFVETDGWRMAQQPAGLVEKLALPDPTAISVHARALSEDVNAATSSAEGPAKRRGRPPKTTTDGV